MRPGEGETRLFIRPGHRFELVSGLITNFHLPKSSLLFLAAAFAGRERDPRRLSRCRAARGIGSTATATRCCSVINSESLTRERSTALVPEQSVHFVTIAFHLDSVGRRHFVTGSST